MGPGRAGGNGECSFWQLLKKLANIHMHKPGGLGASPPPGEIGEMPVNKLKLLWRIAYSKQKVEKPLKYVAVHTSGQQQDLQWPCSEHSFLVRQKLHSAIVWAFHIPVSMAFANQLHIIIASLLLLVSSTILMVESQTSVFRCRYKSNSNL